MKAHRIHTSGSQHTFPNTQCQFSVNDFWPHPTIQPPHFLLFLPLPAFPGSNAASYREHSLITLLDELSVLSALLIHEFPLSTNSIHCHIIFHLEEGSSYLCAQWFINHFLPQSHSLDVCSYCLYFIVKETTGSSSPSPIDPNSLTSVKISLQLS